MQDAARPAVRSPFLLLSTYFACKVPGPSPGKRPLPSAAAQQLAGLPELPRRCLLRSHALT